MSYIVRSTIEYVQTEDTNPSQVSFFISFGRNSHMVIVLSFYQDIELKNLDLYSLVYLIGEKMSGK